MSKELEAIKYLNDTCIKFLDRTKELYCTVTFTRKRAEILRDDIAEVNKALQRLEAIDNANPSKALECLEQFINEMTRCLENPKEYVKGYEKQIFWKYKNTLETTVKQALLKAEQDKKKLKEIEKLTYLLYSERRKIGQEYVKWCKENNILVSDETNMITWVLAIKLKELLNNE